MKKITWILLLIVAAWGCKKEVAQPEYNTDPVVTAYLQAGSVVSVQLAHQQSASAQTYPAPSVDNLDVMVTVNDTVHHLAPMGNGLYVDSAFYAQAGGRYDLRFAYNGKQVSAYTIIPSKPTNFAQSVTEISVTQITSSTSSTGGFGDDSRVALTWDNADASYYVVVVQNMETNPEKIVDTVSTSSDTSRVFRNRPTTGTEYDVNGRSFTYFGKHRLILYHINPDYASLYDNSTSSSQSLSTPSTGIANGVGIFTAINADTLYLQVDKK